MDEDLAKLQSEAFKSPSSEKIELPCIWAIELYTPSTISKLLKSIKDLGWEDHYESREGPSIIDWIRQKRLLGIHEKWKTNDILVVTPGAQRAFDGGEKLYANLPEGVLYGRFILKNISSSITMVAIQFILNENSASLLNEPIQADYASLGVTYLEAVRQKRRRLKQKNDEIIFGIYKWFQDNIPGYFSTLDSYTGMPMISLVTSRDYHLPPKENTWSAPDNYTDLLSDFYAHTWRSKESNFDIELRINGDSENIFAVIFGNFDDLTKGLDGSMENLCFYLSRELGTFLEQWALRAILIAQSKELQELQDESSIIIRYAQEAKKRMEKARVRRLALGRDIRATCRDIMLITTNDIIYSSAASLDFSRTPSGYRDQGLVTHLKEEAKKRANALPQIEEEVNTTLSMSDNLSDTIVNLRIQQSVVILTWVFGILGTLIAIISAHAQLINFYHYIKHVVDTLLQATPCL